jgi:hypothetical protein
LREATAALALLRSPNEDVARIAVEDTTEFIKSIKANLNSAIRCKARND